MKEYLTKFSTRAAYEAELSNLDFPNVSYISGDDELVYAESGSSPTHDYRIEIYDDFGKDNGQLCDPDDLRAAQRYSVYLYDIANETYLEDAIDWTLTTDDDGTLIAEIRDGDTQSLSSCMSMATQFAEGTTMLYAVNPLDHSDVYADLSINIINA